MIRKILLSILVIGMMGYTFYEAYDRKLQEKRLADQQKQIVETTTQSGLTEGQKAPNFTLVDLEGKTVSLNDYKGKIIILNFWASWCPPCKEEIPDFVSFKKNKPTNVEVLSVNLTNKEYVSDEDIRKFIREYKINYPVLFDKEGVVMDLYKVITIPTTYILDKDGIIIKKHIGPLTEDELNSLSKKL